MRDDAETTASGAKMEAGAKRGSVRRAVKFFAAASGVIAVILVALVAILRLEVFNAGFHVNFALVLGIGGTVLLGVGLMALSFYSARSGADDAVIGMRDDDSSGGAL